MTTVVVQRWLSFFHDILPQPLLDAVEVIYLNIVMLTERYFNLSNTSLPDAIAFLNLQSLLPPLISILTIYFALVSLYHTTTFFVRSTIFLVKWGALIGIMGAALGYMANNVMSDVFSRNMSQKHSPRSTRPHVWESFEKHRQWREARQDENPYVADAGKVAREMVERIVDATQQAASQGGWWGTLTGLAAKTLVVDDTAGGAAKRDSRTFKDAKAKGKSR
ncbi:hypothetical protein K439DRAFT_1405983 [Ramaria rubella]|nr:hypothetical protein K439DRAFT_1405983 [Ramaria rubella]